MSLYLSSASWLLLLCFNNVIQALWYEFEFVSINNSKSGIVISDFRVRRQSRTSIVLSGPFEFTEDIKNDNCEAKVDIYHSPIGNNQYKLMAFGIRRRPCCILVQNFYWKSVHSVLEKTSNISKIEKGQPICKAYKKGTYLIQGFNFNKNDIPRMVDTGIYKIKFSFYRGNNKVASGGYIFSAKLY